MNINKIPKHILEDIQNRGNSTDSIEAMTPEEAFYEFCQWNGLSGWADTLIEALDSLRKAALEKTNEHIRNPHSSTSKDCR